jgi:serine/threonine-protein kinase
MAPPRPSGDVIAGKYRVERFLGEGAMGTVVAAYHLLLDVPVAVKLLSPELVRYPQLVQRFLREARSAARLKSEHVVRVMDVGTIEGGQPYIVMELLEGEDLERRLQRAGALPIDQAIDFVLQALEAAAHAHAAGIVHRDLKPANLFVTSAPDGREVVKVLDFGIAKLSAESRAQRAGTESGALTGEHSALGSPSYMAPEQVQSSRDIDARADVWAFGTLLYEMFTGSPAFKGQSVGEIFGAVLHTKPEPLRVVRPELPEELEGAVMRCLERPREARFQNVGELAAAIAPFGSVAFAEYVARIEHTLERAGKSSDPGRFSDPGRSSDSLRDLRSVPSFDAPTGKRVRRLGASIPSPSSEAARIASADTLLDGAHAEPDAPPPRPRRGLVVAVAVAAALAVGGATTHAVTMRSGPSPTPTPSASATAPSAPPASEIPVAPPVLDEPPLVTSSPPVPSSVPSPPEASAPPPPPTRPAAARPAAVVHATTTARAAGPAAASASTKPRPDALPSILNSSE